MRTFEFDDDRYKYSTLASVSFSLFDITEPTEKDEIISEAEAK